MIKKILILLFLLNTFGFLIMADDIDLQKGIEAYRKAKYQESLNYLRKALKNQLTKDQKKEAYKYLAFNYLAMKNTSLAKDAFLNLLILDPEYEISEDEASPKILKLFQQTKEESKEVIMKMQAERYYSEGLTLAKAEDYENAIKKIKMAISILPKENKYKEALEKISKEREEYEKKKLIEARIKDMVFIEGGEAVIGTGKNQKIIQVEGFYIDKYLVSNRDYSYFLEETKRKPPEDWIGGSYPLGKADHPVVNVSYEDAKEYCKWKKKRLPTDVEWEKAARGKEGLNYPYGLSFIKGICNTSEAKIKDTTPVYANKKCVSPFGVYDMSGNVWQWIDTAEGDKYIIKGGSYKSDADDAVAYKYKKESRTKKKKDLGFRCALDKDFDLTK